MPTTDARDHVPVVLAVRPYERGLRAKVFALLQNAGLAVEAPAELAGGSDAALVDELRSKTADFLLVPFHVVRTAAGQRTNGLQLIRRLRREVPRWRGVPVIMPVSLFAGLAFRGAWALHAESNVFVMHEDGLAHPETRRQLARFIGTGGGTVNAE